MTSTQCITIRKAGSGDAEALDRLAQLDSAKVPEGELIVALVGDELRAALPQTGGRAIANPFYLTDALVEAMRVCG